MVLAHAQPCATTPVDETIGIPQRAFLRTAVFTLRRERLRFGGAGSQRIEPLIREMGEVEDATRYGPRSPAVFVNSGARVERRRENVLSRALADHHAAARFPRPRFEPINLVTVQVVSAAVAEKGQ